MNKNIKKCLFCIILFVNIVRSEDGEEQQSHIHLNIEYPNDDASKLNLNTEKNEQQFSRKTPVVIMAPTPLVDYERLYKKMMKLKPGAKRNPENDVVYEEKVVWNDPVYKREMLYKLLRDVESKIAFYRADQNQLEMVSKVNAFGQLYVQIMGSGVGM